MTAPIFLYICACSFVSTPSAMTWSSGASDKLHYFLTPPVILSLPQKFQIQFHHINVELWRCIERRVTAPNVIHFNNKSFLFHLLYNRQKLFWILHVCTFCHLQVQIFMVQIRSGYIYRYRYMEGIYLIFFPLSAAISARSHILAMDKFRLSMW